mmetsp:Transcript_37628/g.86913  ORF Transcript_37628/g.86913 Transcript_37628/m.86913 type:complete len:571 (+) Transcript_37628:73-1785(+)
MQVPAPPHPHPTRGPILVRTTVTAPHPSPHGGATRQASQPSHQLPAKGCSVSQPAAQGCSVSQPAAQPQQQVIATGPSKTPPQPLQATAQPPAAAQQVRVRSVSPGPGNGLRPTLTPNSSQPVTTLKEAMQHRSPGLLGSRQVLSDRGPAAAAVAAQSRHLQSWPGHMRSFSGSQQPPSPASSQATQIIFPDGLHRGLSHVRDMSHGGELSTAGVEVAADSVAVARLQEAIASLQQKLADDFAEVREWAEEKFTALEEDVMDQTGILTRTMEGFRIELTSLREEHRAVEDTTSERLENLEGWHETVDDKLQGLEARLIRAAETLESEVSELQLLKQHVHRDVDEALEQLKDSVVSSRRQSADGDRELNEELQLQQEALRRLEKSLSEASHQMPTVQQDLADLGAQCAALRERSKDAQAAVDAMAQQSAKSLEQLHLQVQACKEQLMQMPQEMDRKMHSIEAAMQSSLAQKADQDWVDEAMHTRAQNISTNLRKEMADRSAAVQQVRDDMAHNAARWRQVQAKLDDLHMEVQEKSLGRSATSPGGPATRSDRLSTVGTTSSVTPAGGSAAQ